MSLLSASGVPLEDIARLVGHSGTAVTAEAVYRKQIQPVTDRDATAMNRIFPATSRIHSHAVRLRTPEKATPK